jgi:hypothetical protein
LENFGSSVNITNFAKYFGGEKMEKKSHTHTHTHTNPLTWTHLMSFVNFEFQRVIKKEKKVV